MWTPVPQLWTAGGLQRVVLTTAGTPGLVASGSGLGLTSSAAFSFATPVEDARLTDCTALALCRFTAPATSSAPSDPILTRGQDSFGAGWNFAISYSGSNQAGCSVVNAGPAQSSQLGTSDINGKRGVIAGVGSIAANEVSVYWAGRLEGTRTWVGGNTAFRDSAARGWAFGRNVNSGLSGFGHIVEMIAAWNRVLSAGEIAALSENPWQLFRPRRPTLYSLPSASTTVNSYVASGGAVLSGAAARARTKTATVSGGLAASGAAARARTKAFATTGGAQLAGSAAASFTGATIRTYVGTGGVVSGGAAARVRTRAFASAGGAVLAGSAASTFTGATIRAYTASGGAAVGGGALFVRTRAFRAAGGALAAGSASTVLVAFDAWRKVRTSLVAVQLRRASRVEI
jgi:hypothetical protein